MTERKRGPKTMPRYQEIARQAVYRAGGPAAVAEALGMNPESVRQWYNRDAHGRVPANHVAMMARLSGMSKAELRPDLYGDE